MKLFKTSFYFFATVFVLTTSVSAAGNQNIGDGGVRRLGKRAKASKECLEYANTSKATKCPGYSTCNCIAGPGGFFECLSGGVTERCSSCTQECKKDRRALLDKEASNEARLLDDKKDAEFRCGCFDLETHEQIDCVPFNFPEECVTGCDNGNVITPRMRDACLCHFMKDHKCTPEKCLEAQLEADEEGEDPSDCRCFCQSYFADYGGPHANCVEVGTAPTPDTCPTEGIRHYGRVYKTRK